MVHNKHPNGVANYLLPLLLSFYSSSSMILHNFYANVGVIIISGETLSHSLLLIEACEADLAEIRLVAVRLLILSRGAWTHIRLVLQVVVPEEVDEEPNYHESAQGMEEAVRLRCVMVMMDGAALVQFSVLTTLMVNVMMTMAVRQTMVMVIDMIVMVDISFSCMTALLKLADDLEGVLVLVIFPIEVVVVVERHVTWRVHESSMRDVTAEKRMWVSEGAFCKRTAMST